VGGIQKRVEAVTVVEGGTAASERLNGMKVAYLRADPEICRLEAGEIEGTCCVNTNIVLGWAMVLGASASVLFIVVVSGTDNTVFLLCVISPFAIISLMFVAGLVYGKGPCGIFDLMIRAGANPTRGAKVSSV